MPKQITNLEIDEVSLVAKGANQHAKVTIAKSAEGNDIMGDLFDQNGNPVEEDALEHGDVVFGEDGQAFVFNADGEDPIDTDQLELEFDEDDEPQLVGKSFGPEMKSQFGGPAFAKKGSKKAAFKNQAKNALGGYAAGAGAGAAAGAVAGLASKGKFKAGPGALFGGAAGAAVGGNGGAIRGAHQNVKRGYFGKSASTSYAEDLREELSKSLTDKDRDDVISKAFGRIEEMENISKSALAAAAEERDIRLTQEYTEIAKSYNLPVEDTELGAALKECAENLSDETCTTIAKCLGAAGEVLFEEYGAQGGGDNQDIFSEVTKSAGRELSLEEMNEVFSTTPELYEAYLADQGR